MRPPTWDSQAIEFGACDSKRRTGLCRRQLAAGRLRRVFVLLRHRLPVLFEHMFGPFEPDQRLFDANGGRCSGRALEQSGGCHRCVDASCRFRDVPRFALEFCAGLREVAALPVQRLDRCRETTQRGAHRQDRRIDGKLVQPSALACCLLFGGFGVRARVRQAGKSRGPLRGRVRR